MPLVGCMLWALSATALLYAAKLLLRNPAAIQADRETSIDIRLHNRTPGLVLAALSVGLLLFAYARLLSVPALSIIIVTLVMAATALVWTIVAVAKLPRWRPRVQFHLAIVIGVALFIGGKALRDGEVTLADGFMLLGLATWLGLIARHLLHEATSNPPSPPRT